MEPSSPGSLEEEVRELRARVQRLEHALTRQGILAESWNPPMQVQAVPAVSPEPAAHLAAPEPMNAVPLDERVPASAVPSFAQFQSKDHSQETDGSLESRIGSQWFNRIGILAVLIGMAWFLKLAIDNQWIGPFGRVLIGLIAGGALIAWSERFRSKGYRAFSYSLKSAGTGILYLSLWAAFALYQLIPGPVAFFAMVAVTAFNGFLAWIQDSELLAVYAIAGGFGTPLLVSTGENHEIALFSYMLLLDLAVLVLVALRPWSRLLFGASLGTFFYAAAWYFAYYTTAQLAPTVFFFLCFFLLFALAPRLVLTSIAGPDPADTSPWDKLATIVLPVANAAVGFLAFYGLLDSAGHSDASPWLAVSFAAFYLFLLRIPAMGCWRAHPALLAELHLATAVVFLTIAIPLKASGRWLTIGWLAEGAALLWVSAHMRSRLLQALGVLCLAFAVVVLVTLDVPAGATPLFNQRFATYLAAIATFAFVTWLGGRHRTPAAATENDPWTVIAIASALLINILILLAISLEIHAYWWSGHWGGSYPAYAVHRMYAQFTYSAFFMLYGALLLALGFSRKSAFLRWQALVLLAVSICKVFLVDVSALSQGYRIVSFICLGALLLGVSFVYQRDLFSLRHHGSEDK